MNDFYKEDSGSSELADLKSAIKKAKAEASDLRKKLELPIPLGVHSLIQVLGLPAKDLRAFTKKKNKTLEDIIDRYKVSKEVVLCAINENKLLMRIKID